VSRFPLEARGSHESRGASGTRVPPQARLAVLPIQTIQTSRALNPRRSWWSSGTRHAWWASNPFAALLRLGAGWAGCSSFARESRGTRWAGKAWLALKSLVALLSRVSLGSSLSPGTHWAWGTWEAFRSWWARFSLLSWGPDVAPLPLDAGQSWGAHGTWVARLPWRTRFPLLSCQAPEASLSLKTRQSGGANSTRKTWGANRAWRTWGAPHARRTLFSSLAGQPWRTGQAGAPSTVWIPLAAVSPGLLSSWALPLCEAPGTAVQAWHAGDTLVSLLAFFQERNWAGCVPLDTVPAEALTREREGQRGPRTQATLAETPPRAARPYLPAIPRGCSLGLLGTTLFSFPRWSFSLLL